MTELKKTLFHDLHVAAGAKMVEFGGWEMPVFYPTGIIAEHLATRKGAGLFDVSHMGRFIVRGRGALGFLQHVLTNNAEGLDIRTAGAQYTLIPTTTGGAVDDAYLYRFVEEEYLLVVNAANREKDWNHLVRLAKEFQDVELMDQSEDIVMLALQGPKSRALMEQIVSSGRLPEPMRNAVSQVEISGAQVKVSRTGYTGEPLCFELFADRKDGLMLWELILSNGATPIGLGARDTLRLEAGLPLYGHELGQDRDGKEIPVMACPLSRFAVSFSPLKGDFIGREALTRQQAALKQILAGDFSHIQDLPRMIRHLAVIGRGIAREGAMLFKDTMKVGYVTSGTAVPLWRVEGEGLESRFVDEHELRSIALCYIDSDILDEEQLLVEIRGKKADALTVPFHMRSEAPPYARPILANHPAPTHELPFDDRPSLAKALMTEAIRNTVWRQRECINLIPSEMTISPMARLLSVMDPAFRYAEHRKSPAFYQADIFYYQGTRFIGRVEEMLEAEMKAFLGCKEVETRLISGQMANTAVFSAMVDYLNRADRKQEPGRIRQIMNNHIGKGGHLSAQPMGALKDYVARDPRTERPAVVNFPVMPDNPFQMDVPATLKLIDQYRPELIIFGKSMVLHKEPVSEIRQFLDDQGIPSVVMYDMAHVLGLVGPHFQEPFAEGADLVTGSTHKTFFGTQRGIVGCGFEEQDERYALWESIQRRAFPGSVSNHHLGTLLGLLMAAYEMNHFKDIYQRQVIANAKAFARALRDAGLKVAGDPAIDFTETHQVVVDVGYGRGPEIAERLEANNIICNYQANTDEEGFTASGALRMGVSEMTRFGMEAADFQALAQLMRDVIVDNATVLDQVKKMRAGFQELKFCFKGHEYDDLIQELHSLIA
ncbi:MAG: glycine cleavage system aminomethyltransferase GcvT [Deltaproteobacteria bacterium]|nr:glycine cleavage system aminomethyltransferase GcvT [Deltaproteobacteria bacterium]